MKKKIVDFKKSSDGKNRIELVEDKFAEINAEADIEVKIYDEAGNLIENSDKLKQSWRKNHVEIFLGFHPKDWKTEIDKGDVTYYLNNIEQRTEYQRCKNEALSRYICENIVPPEIAGTTTIKYEPLKDKVKCLILKNSSNTKSEIIVRLENQDIPNPNDRTVDAKTYTIFATFKPNNSVETDEFITFPSPIVPKESFWTPTKIFVAFFAAGLIVALLYFYRKKIWSWIKREDKTKKKEQVEIF